MGRSIRIIANGSIDVFPGFLERVNDMSKFTEYIGSQFGNPRGFVGKVCCEIMNIINKAMYKNTVSMIDISSGSNLLDIGYGNGYLLKCVYKKTMANLYGIDISESQRYEKATN